MQKLLIKHFDELTLRELYALKQARDEVFFLEQRITDVDADDVDFVCRHMWIEDDSQIAAYLRIIPAGAFYEEASIGRVLVRKPWRGKGLCRKMMWKAIELIDKESEGSTIVIGAQSYLVNFYREFGFEPFGKEYIDAGIPHCHMKRAVSLVIKNKQCFL